MEAGAGRLPGKDGVGQGRRASTPGEGYKDCAAEEQAVCAAGLDSGERAPPASAVGSRSRAQLNPYGNGHTGGREQGGWAYKGGGLSEGATHGSLPSSASYSQTPLVAQSTIHRSRQGWSLGGSLNDVHPAEG